MFIIGAFAYREEVGYALAAAVCLQLTAEGSLELRTGYGIAHMKHLCTLGNKIQDSYAGCWGLTGFEKYIYESNLSDYTPVYQPKFMYSNLKSSSKKNLNL